MTLEVRNENVAIAVPEVLPPPWAESFAEDEFGVSAELTWGGVEFCFRWIGPGVFQMGSEHESDHSYVRAIPVHEVTLDAGFWMMETPVTQAQWAVSKLPMDSGFKGEQRPVEQVSWRDAMEFIAAFNDAFPDLRTRLPWEAEWEYGCRAGTTTRFNDGSNALESMDSLGWFSNNSESDTHPVRLKTPNEWGLFDMHGNVWEWCHDGVRGYQAEAVVNPSGPDDDSAERVIRGGSWCSSAQRCRSAVRYAVSPEDRYYDVGFRLAAG